MTNDKVINEFKSVKDAAALLGVSTSSIYTACAKGKQIKGRILQYRDAPQAQAVGTSQEVSSTTSRHRHLLVMIKRAILYP